MSRRKEWDEGWRGPYLLPWENRPDAPPTGQPAQVNATDPVPLLYGPDGKPLSKRRPLGFRPEDARR